jgi:hypothetical protein
VRSTTFLFTTLCTFIQIFGVFPFQTVTVELVLSPCRDVAPAKESGAPTPRRTAGPRPQARYAAQGRASLGYGPPETGTHAKHHGNPRCRVPCPGTRARRALPVLPALLCRRTTSLPAARPWRSGTSCRSVEPLIRSQCQSSRVLSRPVQPPVRRGPPWPPPLDTCLCPPPRSIDPSETPSRIHRSSSRHPSPHPAPPLTRRQATAAVAQVRRRGPSPVLLSTRPSEGIKLRRPPGHPTPGSGQPHRRGSPESRRARRPAAQGPHCTGRHLSRVVFVK